MLPNHRPRPPPGSTKNSQLLQIKTPSGVHTLLQTSLPQPAWLPPDHRHQVDSKHSILKRWISIFFFSSLASLAGSCCRLRSLDLGKCSVTDSGLAALGRSLQGLRKLSVRGCREVGEAGLLALAASCPALQHLNVAEVDGLSRAALRGVATLCRNCSIET